MKIMLNFLPLAAGGGVQVALAFKLRPGSLVVSFGRLTKQKSYHTVISALSSIKGEKGWRGWYLFKGYGS